MSAPRQAYRVRYRPETLPTHLEALERLMYVARNRGVGLLSGPAGSGKSRLLNRIGEVLSESGLRVSRLDLTGWTHEELPVRLAISLGLTVGPKQTASAAWLKFEQYVGTLRRMSHRHALLIDHLDRSQRGCEHVIDRLLTVTQGGIPCLMAVESRIDDRLQHVLQRHCGLRIELPQLTENETRTYLEGTGRPPHGPIFSAQALKAVQVASRGQLRSIDRIVQLALEALGDEATLTIDDEIVHGAAAELRS